MEGGKKGEKMTSETREKCVDSFEYFRMKL